DGLVLFFAIIVEFIPDFGDSSRREGEEKVANEHTETRRPKERARWALARRHPFWNASTLPNIHIQCYKSKKSRRYNSANQYTSTGRFSGENECKMISTFIGQLEFGGCRVSQLDGAKLTMPLLR
ncbi:5196_t:CDS:1, partial [Acaulospora colombiana]